METLKKRTSNRNCIINNTLVFVLAYLMVFFILQAGIAITAFAYGVPMILYTSTIDFDAVNTAASADIWSSADNVIAIFGSSIVALFLLMIIAVLLLTQWKTDKVQIQRFLFWVAVCSFVRIGGNFITGHLFHLWNINLVTDFMGITYPSTFGKLLFLIVTLLFIVTGFWCASFLIKYIIDPFEGRINDDLKSNILLPALWGSIMVNLFFIPNRPRFIWTEVIDVVIILAGLLLILKPSITKRYNFVEERKNNGDDVYDERLNAPLLFTLAIVLVAIKMLFDNGLVFEPSPYRNYFFENVVFIACAVIVLLFIIYLFYSYKSKKRKRETLIAADRMQNEEEDKSISDEEWGVRKHDMSKYNDWED